MTAVVGEELEVKLGNMTGASFRVQYRSDLGKMSRVEGNVHAGTIGAGWKKIAVLTHNARTGLRLWVLEPADAVTEIALGPFYIRGRFTETHINNERAAREAWEAFAAL